jgi:hypothetical protein
VWVFLARGDCAGGGSGCGGVDLEKEWDYLNAVTGIEGMIGMVWDRMGWNWIPRGMDSALDGVWF